jgi:polysaccharide export outer membrane protein
MLRKIFPIILLLPLLFIRCKTIYSNRMLETPPDYKFAEPPKLESKEEFKLAINDVFTFRLFTNDGFKLVDMNINTSSSNQTGTAMSFQIDRDSTSKLPLLGKINLCGLTIKQAEDTLEEIFSNYYVKPFVLLTVSNRRIIMFNSGEGGAVILPLVGNTISLIEAIASGGGIPRGSKSFSIKIIRGETQKPIIFRVDLSTLEGYQKGNIILQSNDIVYIDARPRYLNNVVAEFTPYLALLNSFAITYSILYRFK